MVNPIKGDMRASLPDFNNAVSNPNATSDGMQEVKKSETQIVPQITKIDAIFKTQNFIILKDFHHNKEHYQPHVDNSRAMIMSGASSLDSSSKVVVIGPGPLEPLAELAKRCGQLLLINNDEYSLQIYAKRLHENNVSWKKMELTEGLYVRMDEIIGRASEENWNAQRVIDEFISLFNSYRPTNLLEDPILKEADYVVSSQIATQFTVIAEQRISEFFLEKFNITLLKYMREAPKSVLDVYGKAVYELCDHLIIEYGKSIAKMIKPTGRIYLSDTVSTLKFFTRPGITGIFKAVTPTMSSSNFPKIEAHFQVLETKEWDWYSIPTDPSGYVVHADLLKLKQD